ICVTAGLLDSSRQVSMVIPCVVIELNKTYTPLDQASRQQAVVCEGRLPWLCTIQLKSLRGFRLEVHQLWHTCLHAKGQFKRANPRCNLRIAHGLQFELIEFTNPIKDSTANSLIDSLGIRNKKNGFALRA